MPDQDTPKREPPFSYRPPAGKRAAFERRVAESGLSTNAFITECVLGRNRNRPAEAKLLARLLGQCGNVSDRLREFGSAFERDNHADLQKSVCAELTEIRSALFVLLGRRP